MAKNAQPSGAVNPAHYFGKGSIETIDVINAFELKYERGNAVKYLCRAGRKHGVNAIEDLRKAQWYLTHAIERLENGADINDV